MEIHSAKFEAVSTIIASGGTDSAEVNANGRMVVGIDLGATLTGTTLGLKNAADGTNFRTAYGTDGNAVSWTVAGGRFLRFDPPLIGLNKIKLVSGSSEGADRTLTVVLAP